jgi:DNA-binding response OmpR family regulator
MLLVEKTVTVSMIEGKHNLTEDAAVAVHRLRRRLLGSNIEIKSQRGLGYWMDAESKKLVWTKLEAA